eukprot:c4057_g1_i2.p1 GENE.c4057_g1_i2~~c4057_g1_i2.p1  ORF type:complete len:172 (+),score=24.74 c4057_g1_i2:189-704(+)
MTVGAAFGSKIMVVRGQPITMGVWDTAGSERYESMSRLYYRGAGAAIICFDLTDSSTWEKVKFWVNELRQSEQDCKIFVAGTKKDLILNHDVTDYAMNMGEIRAYCTSIGCCGFFETSAKENIDIPEMFSQVAETYEPAKGTQSQAPQPLTTKSVAIRKVDTSSSPSCCAK